MVTIPVEGRWSIRSLTDDGVAEALGFLRRDPLINVYLISRLLEERTAAATQMVEVRFNREIVLLASLATNIVLAADPATPRDVVMTAIAAVAERILIRMLPVRAIISPALLVEALWTHLRPRTEPASLARAAGPDAGPTPDPRPVERWTQPIYAIRRRFDFPPLTTARY